MAMLCQQSEQNQSAPKPLNSQTVPYNALGGACNWYFPSKMRFFFRLTFSVGLAVGSLRAVSAQDLAPRAYVITPLHANAVTLTWSFYDGSINFNGALPVSDAKGTYSVPIFSYYHSFGLFGRSANIVAAVPYGVGNFRTAVGVEQQLLRSTIRSLAEE